MCAHPEYASWHVLPTVLTILISGVQQLLHAQACSLQCVQCSAVQCVNKSRVAYCLIVLVNLYKTRSYRCTAAMECHIAEVLQLFLSCCAVQESSFCSAQLHVAAVESCFAPTAAEHTHCQMLVSTYPILP